MSFEDDISALIDRPCRRDGCAQTLPESCPSDDFCSENCEATWRAENNGLTTVDCGDLGIDVIAPEGHPAVPSYRSPQEGAFDEEPAPRSFMELIQRRLWQLWDRLVLGDVEQFRENATGILSAIRPDELPQPSPAVGLMQILPSSWRRDPPVEPIGRPPSVSPAEDEMQRLREQIARVYGVPLPLISPTAPPRPFGDFQVIADPLIPPGVTYIAASDAAEAQLAEPVNFTASPTPDLPFNFFRAPGMPPDRAYHVLPPREGEERRAELVHVALDPAVPDAVPLFYTVETRYDHQRDRVVAELVVRLPPRPAWVNVTIDPADFGLTQEAALDRLEGLDQPGDAEEIVARARELGFRRRRAGP